MNRCKHVWIYLYSFSHPFKVLLDHLHGLRRDLFQVTVYLYEKQNTRLTWLHLARAHHNLMCTEISSRSSNSTFAVLEDRGNVLVKHIDYMSRQEKQYWLCMITWFFFSWLVLIIDWMRQLSEMCTERGLVWEFCATYKTKTWGFRQCQSCINLACLSFCWLRSPAGHSLHESLSITSASTTSLVVTFTPNSI